jgi:hypothetical protein
MRGHHVLFHRKSRGGQKHRIFARLGERGNQVLIYQMSLKRHRIPMVLPIPVKAGSGEDAVKFFDFSKYETRI